MSQTSVAAVFTGAGHPLELRRFPLPELGPGELLVEVTCCTLCGSDLHTYQGHRTTPTPTILGHEAVGRIAALGPGSAARDLNGRPLQVGDRVTWSIAASCGACFFCSEGIPQKCERLFKYGHEALREGHPLSGGLADACHLAAGTAVVSVPDDLPDAVAAPANCATATVAAALRTAGDGSGQVVLVQGAGMLGLTACAMARTQGARAVIATDVDADRLERASRFGATHTVLVREDDSALAALVGHVTSGRGVDLAVELSGSAAAIESGLELLRIGGRYVLVGSVFPGRPVSVSPESVVRRLLKIHGVHNYAPSDLGAAVAFLAQQHGRFPFADLVKETWPLSEVEAAFQRAIDHRPPRIAVTPCRNPAGPAAPRA